MGFSEPPLISPRLKREDCPRTKHDSAFSLWKILIGPSDWEDHSQGKEGAERYRVHNLPSNCSSPGLYELGIDAGVTGTGLGREANKPDPDRIVVVYIGQADSVRARLQQYGRYGAHLENASGLFREIFSRGYPIVFRWAHMRSKQEAEKTETQLLEKFDYAWNKGSNGVRRTDDILLKLDKISLSATWIPKVVRRLQILNHKQVGCRIPAVKLPPNDNESNADSDNKSNDFLSQIFKFGRSQPRLVSDRTGLNVENSSICGVVLADGSVCSRPPVKGRKRCPEHKGMKIAGSISKSKAEEESNGHDLGLKSDIDNDKNIHDHFHNTVKLPSADQFSENATSSSTCRVDSSSKRQTCGSEPTNPKLNIICGMNLGNGFLCERQPAKGRKRCEEHKGMRVKAGTVDMTPDSCGFEPMEENRKSIICGVYLGDGFVCERPPPEGRKRCEEHKGMRIIVHAASSGKTAREDSPSMCGATTSDGSFCRNKPVHGNKRCWQHKGMRDDSFFSKVKTETSSFSCGILLGNGSVCSRMPVPGRKRCEQHKGMRAY